MTDSDVCFEINIIDMYIKRAVSPVYRFNGINIINLNIQQKLGIRLSDQHDHYSDINSLGSYLRNVFTDATQCDQSSPSGAHSEKKKSFRC